MSDARRVAAVLVASASRAIERVIGQRMTRSSLTAEDGLLGAMVFILAHEARS